MAMALGFTMAVETVMMKTHGNPLVTGLTDRGLKD